MAKELQYPENMLFLTTIDNPFNPATQPEFWEQFDRDHGYNSNNLLARFYFSSPELSELDEIDANNAAVNAVVDGDVTDLYIAVKETTKIKV